MTKSVTFPRFSVDILSERRTLFHVPVDAKTWTIDDDLILLAERLRMAYHKLGRVTDARKVRLLAQLDADLGDLGAADRAEYLASWDARHPGQPSFDDPMVWRIAFCYVVDPNPDPPEWSLAS